ncbi:hypothetical protein OROGR_005393 [Orobanche gracilis]
MDIFNSSLLIRSRPAASAGSATVKPLGCAPLARSKLRDIHLEAYHSVRKSDLFLVRGGMRSVEFKMASLEDWASMDDDHLISLLAAIEALRASTLRLPVVGGATANVQSLQDAVGSAIDIMQAMTSSLRSLLPMVEEVNSLVSELAKVMTKEEALLEQ